MINLCKGPLIYISHRNGGGNVANHVFWIWCIVIFHCAIVVCLYAWTLRRHVSFGVETHRKHIHTMSDLTRILEQQLDALQKCFTLFCTTEKKNYRNLLFETEIRYSILWVFFTSKLCTLHIGRVFNGKSERNFSLLQSFSFLIAKQSCEYFHNMWQIRSVNSCCSKMPTRNISLSIAAILLKLNLKNANLIGNSEKNAYESIQFVIKINKFVTWTERQLFAFKTNEGEMNR